MSIGGRGWREVPPGHPLGALHGALLAGRRALVQLGPGNRVGAEYFRVSLEGREGDYLLGLFHVGPVPPHNWVEVMASTLPAGAEEALFALLARIVPPGGHVMVEYEGDARRETDLALQRGVPPLLTPLGLTLFRAGFSAGFKDWYISEGGMEGPRKLQAYRPLNAGHQREGARRMLEEVEGFLRGGGVAPVPRRDVGEVLERLRALARG